VRRRASLKGMHLITSTLLAKARKAKASVELRKTLAWEKRKSLEAERRNSLEAERRKSLEAERRNSTGKKG
jgi:hypothetical protein